MTVDVRSDSGDGQGEAVTTTVRRALTRLHALAPPTSERLATLAFMLSRVANADEHICEAERSCMETIVRNSAEVPPDLAMLAVEIADHRTRMADCACAYSVSRALREAASGQERDRLLHSLLSVAAADGQISAQERAEIDQIATEIGAHGRSVGKAGSE